MRFNAETRRRRDKRRERIGKRGEESELRSDGQGGALSQWRHGDCAEGARLVHPSAARRVLEAEMVTHLG